MEIPISENTHHCNSTPPFNDVILMRPNQCLSSQSAFEIADRFSTLHRAEILR